VFEPTQRYKSNKISCGSYFDCESISRVAYMKSKWNPGLVNATCETIMGAAVARILGKLKDKEACKGGTSPILSRRLRQRCRGG
jgi:hypothetical protein